MKLTDLSKIQRFALQALAGGPITTAKVRERCAQFLPDAVDCARRALQRMQLVTPPTGVATVSLTPHGKRLLKGETVILHSPRGKASLAPSMAKKPARQIPVLITSEPEPHTISPEPTLLERLRDATQVVDKASRVFSGAASRPECLIGQEDALRDSAIDLLEVRELLREIQEVV